MTSGCRNRKHTYSDGVAAWYMSACLYLKQAIVEIEQQWGNLNKLFPKQETLNIPIQAGSHPELDTTQFFKDDNVQLYQSYIGILRWAVEVGCIDLSHVASWGNGMFLRRTKTRTYVDLFKNLRHIVKDMMSQKQYLTQR
jgi:hypothetical protein